MEGMLKIHLKNAENVKDADVICVSCPPFLDDLCRSSGESKANLILL